MDSSQREPLPARLSALYQYHNAPEVAPAHGLEYDDTIYPSSDKYPVIRESPAYGDKLGKYGFGGDNRPPRIIFGMKIRTFLLVALVMVLIVVGAAVGGAVGGKQLRDQQQDAFHENGTYIPAQPSTATSPTSTFTAAVPTYTPLSDCPESNNTAYTSSFNQGSSGTIPQNAGLEFTKYCELSNPLSASGTQRIAEAFVYSFSDCVEVCAAYNFWNDGSNCTVAVYSAVADRPGNCWVGHASNVNASKLNKTEGTDVAILTR